MGYYDIMRGLNSIFDVRIKMVQLAFERGVSEAAANTIPHVKQCVNEQEDTARKVLKDFKTTVEHQSIYLIKHQER